MQVLVIKDEFSKQFKTQELQFPKLLVENVTIKNAALIKKNSFFNLNYGVFQATFNNFLISKYFAIYGVITNDFSIKLD